MIEDDAFAPLAPKPAGVNLDRMSIEELEARVADLKGEIAACEAAIRAKRAQREAANAFFSPSPAQENS